MQLPFSLQNALEQVAEKVPIATLRSMYQKISEGYRRGEPSGHFFRMEAGLLAYLLARMPATYSAAYKVLQALKKSLPNWNCRTVLDIGAGPGTASWAASEIFPALDTITLVEKSREMIAMGRELASFSECSAMKLGHWIEQDITKSFEIPQADLTILSYVLAEVNHLELIEKIWDQGTVLVLIEPGTPKGFEGILKARKNLIARGALIAAPCPHQQSCPISGWCHFPARVERTKLHKIIKEGSLGYEDEKFSYIVAAPFPPVPIEGRVINDPLKLSGHVKMTLCTQQGAIEQKTITRKQKKIYRQARDAEWSSAWM